MASPHHDVLLTVTTLHSTKSKQRSRHISTNNLAKTESNYMKLLSTISTSTSTSIPLLCLALGRFTNGKSFEFGRELDNDYDDA
jgi:hypothetical protein